MPYWRFSIFPRRSLNRNVVNIGNEARARVHILFPSRYINFLLESDCWLFQNAHFRQQFYDLTDNASELSETKRRHRINTFRYTKTVYWQYTLGHWNYSYRRHDKMHFRYATTTVVRVHHFDRFDQSFGVQCKQFESMRIFRFSIAFLCWSMISRLIQTMYWPL